MVTTGDPPWLKDPPWSSCRHWDPVWHPQPPVRMIRPGLKSSEICGTESYVRCEAFLIELAPKWLSFPRMETILWYDLSKINNPDDTSEFADIKFRWISAPSWCDWKSHRGKTCRISRDFQEIPGSQLCSPVISRDFPSFLHLFGCERNGSTAPCQLRQWVQRQWGILIQKRFSGWPQFRCEGLSSIHIYPGLMACFLDVFFFLSF